MASEASYAYILSELKLKKNQNGPNCRLFEKLKLAFKQSYQTGQNLVVNAKINNFK